jgi:hypothetical protein
MELIDAALEVSATRRAMRKREEAQRVPVSIAPGRRLAATPECHFRFRWLSFAAVLLVVAVGLSLFR